MQILTGKYWKTCFSCNLMRRNACTRVDRLHFHFLFANKLACRARYKKTNIDNEMDEEILYTGMLYTSTYDWNWRSVLIFYVSSNHGILIISLEIRSGVILLEPGIYFIRFWGHIFPMAVVLLSRLFPKIIGFIHVFTPTNHLNFI